MAGRELIDLKSGKDSGRGGWFSGRAATQPADLESPLLQQETLLQLLLSALPDLPLPERAEQHATLLPFLAPASAAFLGGTAASVTPTVPSITLG